MATLAQARQAELDAFTTADTAATAELKLARQRSEAAGRILTQAEDALRTTSAAIAAARRRLAEAANPSDAAALNIRIRDLLIDAREQTGAALDAREAQAEADAAVAGARARQERAAAGKARAAAAVAAEATASSRRQAQVAALSAAPLSTIQADATAALADAVTTDAETLIESNFPAELLALATERHASRRSAIQAARASLVAARTADASDAALRAGVAGSVLSAAQAFERAADEVADFVARAKGRFDAALNVLRDLQRIGAERAAGNPTPDILSDAAKADIAATPDRVNAAGAAGPIETSRRAITTARTALDQEILTQMNGAAIDTFPTSAAIANRRTAVDTANTALSNAVTALETGGEKTVLDQWEIVAPDPAWQTLADYLEARAVLSDLGATVVTGANSLVSRLTAAEDAYATALQAEGRAFRRAGAYQDAVTERETRLDALAGSSAIRYPSAVRGDSC
jgi:hypothetical protein